MSNAIDPTGSSGEQQRNQPALATLMHNLPGMVYRCRLDAQRTMLFASQGSKDVTGYEPEALIDNQVAAYGDLIHPEDREAAAQEIEAAGTEKRPYRCVYRLMTADGQERWVQDKGEATGSVENEIEVLEGFVTDYSERMTTFQILEQRVADRTRKLAALYDILEVASDSSDLETTLSGSLQRVLKAIRADVGAIHLLERSGTTLAITAQQSLPKTAAAQIDSLAVDDHQAMGWVVRHNEPLLISKMSADPRAAQITFDRKLDVYIGIPIAANDQVLGVLSVFSEDISRYAAKEEIALLSSVGEQLGVVVENARLRQKAEQLAVLEERNRLARELHDSVTQSLYSVTLFAEAGRNLAETGEFERASQLFPDVLETGQRALKEMRLLVHKLRPSALEKMGLVKALQHRLNAVEGRAGIKNELVVKGTIDLELEVEEALYHVVQEALNNAIKHAGASQVKVHLYQEKSGQIDLSVTDDGTGFQPETASETGGLGLTSMRERIEKLQGSFKIQSETGKGTRVMVHLDMNKRI